MLIFLVPGLLAMGITGAIISVVQNPGDMIAGTVFGEPVYQREFDAHKTLYRITNPRSEDEEAWRFLAFLKAAERAGIEVSDSEIREGIHTDMKWSMARYKAMKELEKEGVNWNDPNVNRRFQQKFFEMLGQGEDKELDIAEYKKTVIEQHGVDHRLYEKQQERELLVRRFLDTLRAMATVDSTEVEKAYQDKHHLRVAEFVGVPADRYLPDLKAKEGEPGFISNEQVDDYYKRNELDFDEPRRVNLDYVAIDFKSAEDGLAHPGADALKAYNARRGIVAIGSEAEAEDQLLEAWYADKARSRAMDAMEQIEDEVKAAQKAKPDAPVDLKAIAAKVRSATKLDALLDGKTGLVTATDLTKDDRDFLAGHAVREWFKHKKQGSVSSAMGNIDALVIVQTGEVKHAKTPKKEDILAQIKEGYVNGTEAERRRYYDEHKNVKYRKPVTYHVDLATYADSEFGGDHAKALEAAEEVRETVEKLARERKGAFKDGRKFDWYLLGTDPAIKKPMKTPSEDKEEAFAKLSKEDLEKHAQLGKAAAAVPTAATYSIKVVEFEGGVGLWRLVRRNPVKTLTFEEAEDKVREDLRKSRGLERLEDSADDLLAKLKHKDGEELQKLLAEMKLSLYTTKPFDRTTTTLPGLTNAGSLVGECFAGSAEVGGTFEQWVSDTDKDRILLVRVAKRLDAPAEGFQKAYPELREELLTKERGEFAQEQIRDIVLEAKGISAQHMAYATELRDGPGGVSRLKIRQIFLPPDSEITGSWLENAAKTRAEKALAELKGGKSWGAVVSAYSEHQSTRSREGELPPSSKENLAESFGNGFAEEAYAIGEGETPRLIQSDQGFHLVKLQGSSKGRKIFRHVLISTDPVRRKLPKEIEEQAEKKSKAALEAALARLEKGESFAKVAEEVGTADDALATGKEFEVEFVTAFERAALAQPFEWELSTDDPRANDQAWVPEVVEVKGPSGSSWHLFACAKEPGDRIASWDPPARRDRHVFHVQCSSKSRAEQARQEMVDFMKEGDEDGDRPSWFMTIKKFKEIAAEYSEAPDAPKGGAFGVVRLEEGIRAYGDAFYTAMGFNGDAAVTKGHRTAVFRGETGYHIVEVVDVTVSEPGDRERGEQVAELVLNGTGWQ